MKSTIKIAFTLLILGVFLSSFSVSKVQSVFGTYGGSNDMQLTINEDFTFVFKNSFVKGKDKTATGFWKSQNGKIILTSLERNDHLPTKWIVRKEGKVIKSRKGLTFYSLMKD